MAQHRLPDNGFYDDEATRQMSEAFVMAWQVLEALQANGHDERAETILRTKIAAAILELAAPGVDCEMIALGAIDQINAARRFRVG